MRDKQHSLGEGSDPPRHTLSAYRPHRLNPFGAMERASHIGKWSQGRPIDRIHVPNAYKLLATKPGFNYEFVAKGEG